jgi:hypothetical protein
MIAEFTEVGYQIITGFLSVDECGRLTAAVNDYRSAHDVPVVHRPASERPLHYAVIDGEKVRNHFPDVTRIAEDVGNLVNSISDEALLLLSDSKVAVNINITSKGGSYRWHYDRNAVTAILYLNEVEGGETECYPNYRLKMPGDGNSMWQKIADRVIRSKPVRRIFGRRVMVSPKAGTLLVMRGNQCLHSVLPVTGNADRVNVIISFDLPGKTFAVADGLNQYLYTGESTSGDPNYS